MTIRRLKTYTGSQGYVYQYYFVGKRPAVHAGPQVSATEYVFDVTSDRKTTYEVIVVLPQAVVAAWNDMHSRDLSDSEQYAAVKLRLFRAFDELTYMEIQGCGLQIDTVFLDQSLAGLGIE